MTPKLEAVFDDDTQTVRVRPRAENREDVSTNDDEGRIADSAAGQDTSTAAAGTAPMDVDDTAAEDGGGDDNTQKARDEAHASKLGAAAGVAAGRAGDSDALDVEMTVADTSSNNSNDGNNHAHDAHDGDGNGNGDGDDERKMPAATEPSTDAAASTANGGGSAAAAASTTTMGVDEDNGAEERKDEEMGKEEEQEDEDEDDDKKPSAEGSANASSAAAAASGDASGDAIRRNEHGNRLCSVADCPKRGRRESGWMCRLHYHELEERDPAPAAAAAAAAATPRSQPIHITAQEGDRFRRDADGRRMCDVADCPKRARREHGWMCGPHYRGLKERDPTAAAVAKAAASANAIRGPRSVPTSRGSTPGLEDANTPTPIGAIQQSEKKKKPLVSSAELSSLYDGWNGGIELAPRRPKRQAPDDPSANADAYAEVNEGATSGRYPARKRARTDQQAAVDANFASAASKSSNASTKNAPSAADATAAVTRDGNVRRDRKGRVLCAVEGCPKASRSDSGRMCMAHYRHCNENGYKPANLEVDADGETIFVRGKKGSAANNSTGTSAAVAEDHVRRNSRGDRYCAVENCQKLSKGSNTKWMCKAHFKEFIDNTAATDGTATSTGASASSRSSRLSSSTAPSSTHATCMVSVTGVTVGGEDEWGDAKEALLPAAGDSTSTSATATTPPAKKSTPRNEPDFDHVEPLGKPENLPTLPDTGKCQWSFERETRVLHAKFSPRKHEMVHPVDYEFLTKMMELDHISVVSEGLVDELNPSLWNLRFIAGLAGDEYCHRVRRFSRQIVTESELTKDSLALNSTEEGSATTKYFVTHREEKTNVSMKLSDYFNYLAQRKACLQRIASVREGKGLDPVNPSSHDDRVGRAEGDEESFAFISHDDKECSVNVVDDVLYLIDYDMIKLLPSLHEDFAKAFKAKDFLPGGGECMMNNINMNGRPSMGPNFYVTPPASFTAFHQDGHGTVDSGHVCLSGHNEVIMLRRMPEENKLHAMSILSGGKDGDGSYNALYGLPHLDGFSHFPLWPTKDAIEKCEEMNYAPSVFILSPGQMIHINKGRLHAFRKLSPFALPSSDCHAELRTEVLQKGGNPLVEQTCMSVAWDWEYKGVTAEGINREMASTLECSKLNREHNVQSLAVPETSILFMARRHVSEHEFQLSQMSDDHQNEAVLAFLSAESDASTTGAESNGGDAATNSSTSSSLQVLRGLLPSLAYIVNRHKKAYENAKRMEENGDEKRKVSIAPRPDAREAPDRVGIDPFSHGDMSCKGCAAEISQCYMHCDGCEKLLSQDFNVCVDCHSMRRHECFYQMNPVNDRRHASVNHVGNMAFDRNARGACTCKNGPKCKVCTYCLGCSCRCHKSFTMHLRFMSIEDEEALLQRVVAAVGSTPLPPDATLARLVKDEEGGDAADA